MPDVPPTPAARRGVFTSREALGAGWTISGLKYAVRDTGELERLRRGCFAPPPATDLSTHEVRDLRLVRTSVAASLCARDVAVSHLASALLLDLPTWAPAPQACVTTHRDIQLDGVHTHRALARTGHIGRLDGVPVTVPERAIVDIAREFGAEAGLVVADAAARRSLITLGDLDAAIDQLGRHLDVDPARSVLEHVDPAAESPLESRSRWHLALHDLPTPQTQVEIFTVDGAFVGRTDFFWAPGVIGEVDGTSKYVDREVLSREKWRHERLEDLDLEVVRWGRATSGTSSRRRYACVAPSHEPRWHRARSGGWRSLGPRSPTPGGGGSPAGVVGDPATPGVTRPGTPHKIKISAKS